MKLKPDTGLFIVLLMSSGILLWCGLTTGHNWGDDFACYIMQARSVVEGTQSKVVEESRFMMEQSTIPVGPVVAPWGFPVLLAPFYALFGLNMLGLKSVEVIFYLLFLVTLWFGFRRRHSTGWRLALVSLFAFNPSFMVFSNNILSDIPYLFFSTLAVLFIGRVVIERRPIVSGAADGVFLGLVIAVACFIRSHGFLLLIILGLTQVVEAARQAFARRKMVGDGKGDARPCSGSREATDVMGRWFFLLPYVSFAIAMFAWETNFPGGGGSHFGQFGRMTLRHMLELLHYYAESPSEFFWPLPDSTQHVVYGASILLVIWGMLERRHSDYHMIVYMFLTVLLSAFWPIIAGPRYIFPALPFYMSFLITALEVSPPVPRGGLKTLWSAARTVPVIIVILFFVTSSSVLTCRNLASQRTEPTGPYTPAAREVMSFITQYTEPDNVIVFPKPRVMRLYAQRRSIAVDTPSKLNRGNYLCLWRGYRRGQLSNEDVRGLLEDGQIRLVFDNRDFELYYIKQKE